MFIKGKVWRVIFIVFLNGCACTLMCFSKEIRHISPSLSVICLFLWCLGARLFINCDRENKNKRKKGILKIIDPLVKINCIALHVFFWLVFSLFYITFISCLIFTNIVILDMQWKDVILCFVFSPKDKNLDIKKSTFKKVFSFWIFFFKKGYWL